MLLISIIILLVTLIGFFALVHMTWRFKALAGGLALFALFFLSSCLIQIDPGQVGVVILLGKTEKLALESGVHLVNPLADVIRFDIRTQNFTMSAVRDEGDKEGDDAIKVLSKDGLEVAIDLTVLYRVLPQQAPHLLESIGKDYRKVILRPIARTSIRDIAAYYDAVSLYSTKRDEFQLRIIERIEKELKSRGLLLEQLLVRNIDLPASVKTTIESKINAEQEAQKMQFVLQKEQAEASRKRIEAQGIADYQRIVSSTLNTNLLQFESIRSQQSLAASANAKIIIMGSQSGKMPFILSDK